MLARYLPPNICPHANAEFLDNYVKLFNLLFILLGDHDTPTSSNLVTRIQDAALPTDLRFAANEFLSAGGRIEWALACIMDTCEDPDNNVFDARTTKPICRYDPA